MALIWMDGFDHYGDTESNLLAGAYASMSGMTLDASLSRTGSTSLLASAGSSIDKTLPSQKTVVGVGMAIYFSSMPAATNPIIRYMDQSAGVQVVVWLMPTGAIRVTRDAVHTLNVLAESEALALANGSWNHLEVRVAFSNSSGSVEVRVNETAVINEASLDTVATANAECSILRIYPNASNAFGGRIDDFYIWDDQGVNNNDFIGDRRVITLSPSSNAATQQWSVTGAGSAYQAIDDTAPDGDTSYIEASDSVPVVSDFNLSDADASVGAIAAVQTVIMARRSDATSTSVEVSLVSNGDVDAGATHSVGDAYSYYSDVSELDPDTGAPWTRSALNAAVLRVRRTA